MYFTLIVSWYGYEETRIQNMMMNLVIFLHLLPAFILADYVPGNPGAPWREDELLAVKARLQWIFRNPKKALEQVPSTFVSFHKNDENAWFTGKEIYERFDKTIEQGGIKDSFHLVDAALPNIAKVIRLAFHDCVKDEETR